MGKDSLQADAVRRVGHKDAGNQILECGGDQNAVWEVVFPSASNARRSLGRHVEMDAALCPWVAPTVQSRLWSLVHNISSDLDLARSGIMALEISD
jgi:hypothetical protein